MKSGLVFLLCVPLIACQRDNFADRIWERTGETEMEAPVWAYSSDFESTQTSVQLGTEVILRKTQRMNGIEVADSVQIEVRDHEQHPKWIAQRRAVQRHLPIGAAADLLSYRLREGQVRKLIEKAVTAEGFKVWGTERLAVQLRDEEFAAVLEVDVSDPASGGFFADTYSLSGERLERRPAGAHFYDQKSKLAQLYPQGPKKSSLSWVPLFLRAGTEGLTSSFFTLTSQSGDRVLVSQGRLAFALDDTRFDQLQVYYYIEDFLAKLKARHGFQLPSTLKVETHIGYPERTNAAFYYRSVLRFGAGDGTIYQDLMRDPTIIVHEVAHAVIDSLSRLQFEGEAGSINEGFADFIAASILKTPLMGEDSYMKGPYRRSLLVDRDFSSRQGKLYGDSEIVSSFFWRLRELWGAEKTELFALRTVARLFPNAGFLELRRQILALAAELPDEERLQLEKVLNERKWQ